MAEAPVEYSRKFLPREVLSLNATFKHLNIVRQSLPRLLSTHAWLVSLPYLETSLLPLCTEPILTRNSDLVHLTVPALLAQAFLRETVYVRDRGVLVGAVV